MEAEGRNVGCADFMRWLAPTLKNSLRGGQLSIDSIAAANLYPLFFVRTGKPCSSSRPCHPVLVMAGKGQEAEMLTRSLAALPPSGACVSQLLGLSGHDETIDQKRARPSFTAPCGARRLNRYLMN